MLYYEDEEEEDYYSSSGSSASDEEEQEEEGKGSDAAEGGGGAMTSFFRKPKAGAVATGEGNNQRLNKRDIFEDMEGLATVDPRQEGEKERDRLKDYDGDDDGSSDDDSENASDDEEEEEKRKEQKHFVAGEVKKGIESRSSSTSSGKER